MTTLGNVALVNPKEPSLEESAPFITMADVREWGEFASPSGERGTRGGVRARGGDVLMARITPCLENGKIAKVPESLDRVGGSTEFIVIRGSSIVSSDFLFLWAASAETHRASVNLMAGSTGRQRVSAQDVADLPIALPTPAEQRRIVDVMAAVDAQIKSLAEENDRLLQVARARRSELVNDESVPGVRAEQAFDFSTGVRRTPDRATGPNMTPYLRSANVGYGSLDLSDVLQMNYEPHEREKFSLRYGDVLVSEGSASAKAVGMPAVWRDEIAGPVCFQMTLLRLRAIADVCTPGFAFQWCLWAYESGSFLDVAGGTNIKHISAKRSSQMLVRLPSVSRQEAIAEELDAVSAQLTSMRSELAALRSFRSTLLTSLLNQEIEIPESYDRLLGGVS
ncbi:restriction endonuclease subunit S [Nocardia farcinica]|uniref:restriction endonuclease subunit S n=1 Tax=Nocardia farcinica TaxID=37329 RepID=UPI0024560EFF|nr:restriction endonuclease subunit S [Nocardia farcinica]